MVFYEPSWFNHGAETRRYILTVTIINNQKEIKIWFKIINLQCVQRLDSNQRHKRWYTIRRKWFSRNSTKVPEGQQKYGHFNPYPWIFGTVNERDFWENIQKYSLQRHRLLSMSELTTMYLHRGLGQTVRPISTI